MDATQEQVTALSADVRKLTEAVERQADATARLSSEQVQTNTMLRGFINEQRGRNERIDRLIDQHTREIGELQRFQTRVEATTPKTLLDGREIDRRISANTQAIDRINIRLAWWAGGIAVLLAAVEIALKVFL